MSEVEAYQDAIVKLEDAATAVRKITDLVKHGAALLDRETWKSIFVSGTSCQFPERVAFNGAQGTLNAATWPTAEAIATALSEWHTRMTSSFKSGRALPPNRRKGFAEPDKATRWSKQY